MSMSTSVSTDASAQPNILAVNNIEVIYNHVILVLKGVSLVCREGGIVSHSRRQRRGQDDDAESDFQPAAFRARRGDQGIDRVRRRASPGSLAVNWCGAAASR
jgi:hypothetical protein